MKVVCKEDKVAKLLCICTSFEQHFLLYKLEQK